MASRFDDGLEGKNPGGGIGHGDGVLNEFLQLPDVSGKGVCGQPGKKFRRNAQIVFSVFLGRFPREMLDQQRKVLYPLPQRWNMDMMRGNTIVQVLSEHPFLD